MNFLHQYINPNIEPLFFGVYLITLSIQLYFIIIIQRKLAFLKLPKKNGQIRVPVSIIIAARNESDKLFRNLPKILTQKYDVFEVIVVNHQSIDNSKDILEAFSKQNEHLKIVELAEDKHLRTGKKLPLTIGVKAAKYEHLIFTDADCTPNSDRWIEKISAKFHGGKEIVLGYGPMLQSAGLLNKLIRFDTAWIGINYLSMALNNQPYMGVGRNLAYTKSAFFSVDGFKSHYSISSGDDDLFIQEAVKKNGYTIEISPDTFMYSPAKKTMNDWFKQKSRHYQTTHRYPFIKKLLLAIYPISLVLTWICFVSLVQVAFQELYLTISMLILYALKWWIGARCLIKLEEKKLALYFPFWDLFYAIFVPLLFLIAKNKKSTTW
ncbi:MAG: transmembrane glycosyltransferase [Cryomorphaceae bacterium]|nr:transmembrane glycosyltransferase [Cryomorphaceae bacterium]|tara:strand:+ start:12138 stop:13274 length:1137 start_codon:yes stop_codon:yes gene_type:complete